MSDSKGYKRSVKNFLIYPRLQLSLVSINIMVLIGACLVIYFQAKRSFIEIESLATQMKISPESTYYRLIGYQENIILSTILTSSIVAIVLTFIFTVILSHKSAGAIHRLKMYFVNIRARGYVDELQFREGDFYQDLPEAVNDAIKKIKK